MQPKPVPLPPKQPTLPFEIPRRAGPPQETAPPEVEEGLMDRCAPEETWQTLDAPRWDRLLRRTWLRVLEEVVDDA
jgi:hypothetical protein